MDDYSWLDGYTPSNPLLPTSDNLISAAVKFPFPGKQVPSLPICEDQQLHLKQQQQQLQYKAQELQATSKPGAFAKTATTTVFVVCEVLWLRSVGYIKPILGMKRYVH